MMHHFLGPRGSLQVSGKWNKQGLCSDQLGFLQGTLCTGQGSLPVPFSH